jgi:hypothetical protein
MRVPPTHKHTRVTFEPRTHARCHTHTHALTLTFTLPNPLLRTHPQVDATPFIEPGTQQKLTLMLPGPPQAPVAPRGIFFDNVETIFTDKAE